MKKLTEEQIELLEAIENYRNSKHNHSDQLEEFAKECFENLMYN